jgi:hypothetical protein
MDNHNEEAKENIFEVGIIEIPDEGQGMVRQRLGRRTRVGLPAELVRYFPLRRLPQYMGQRRSKHTHAFIFKEDT